MKNTSFSPHEITWDHGKSRRLWSYYSQSKHHQDKYFGRKIGRQVAMLLWRKGLLKGALAILDFSCGKGDLIKHVSQYLTKRQTITGIDVSTASISATLRHNKDNTNFAGAHTITTWPGPLPDCSQDLVFATEVIEHLTEEEVSDALQECRRLLKPGGRLFLTTPNDEILDTEKTLCPECGCIFHRWQHIQSWSVDRLSTCLQEHGFQVDECDTILWGPWLLRIYYQLTRKKFNGLYAIATASNN